MGAFIRDFSVLVGVDRACRAFGTPARSFRHRRRRALQPGVEGEANASPVPDAVASAELEDTAAATTCDPPATAPGPAVALPPLHPAALSSDERFEILTLLCSDRFVDLSPRQVFMTLLDEGDYRCSVRSMYRLLEDHGLSGERRRGAHRNPGHYPVPVVQAARPNEAWSWDITKLRGPAKGSLYFLYTILDIYSRKVVGWTLTERESARTAQRLIHRTVEREGVTRDQLTLHADRGSSMTSKPVALLLADLGVTKTHSRPHVSNDNPFSEAQFKTLNYCPQFPGRFGSLEDGRAFGQVFFPWYNQDHRHSGLGFLTPAVVHVGQAPTVRAQRQQVLAAADTAHPERFVNGRPICRPPCGSTHLRRHRPRRRRQEQRPSPSTTSGSTRFATPTTTSPA